jgi:hypothetical protein
MDDKSTAAFQPVTGNRKRPGYKTVIEWISESLLQIKPESVVKSFAICGYCHNPSCEWFIICFQFKFEFTTYAFYK